MTKAAAPIRVGYDVAGSFLYQAQDGEFRGYNVEYLYKISQYTGWTYEFVPFTNWGQAVDALEKGDIDILPTVLKSPERQKKMLFSFRNMGNTYVALIVPKSQEQYFFGDLHSLQGSRIGIRKGTVDANEFIHWAQNQNLQYMPVEFDNQMELLTALDQGDIAAAAMSFTGKARNYKAIAEFAPQEMYFGVAQGRRDILYQMDFAMGQIAIMDPEFIIGLTRQYMEAGTTPAPVFSLAERQFIAASEPLRVTLLQDSAPFSHMESDGSFNGILPDLLKRIEGLSGLKFTFVPVHSQTEALQAICDGKADIIGRLATDVFFAERNNLRLTRPYIDMPMTQIVHTGTSDIHKIVLQEASLKDIVAAGGADDSVQYKACADMERCFDTLANGQVDAMYCDSVTATYLLRSHRLSEYQITAMRAYSYNLAFGICKGKDPKLANILDKCIRYITTADIDGMVVRNSFPRNPSFSSIVDQLPGSQVLAILGGLSLLVLCMAYLSFSLWRKRGAEKRVAAIREKNHQIQADLDAAQKINEAKEDFFSHISHDMRTPLNGIIGFTRLAGQAPTLESAREYIDKIRISSGLMLDLVNDTLQLSKLDRGKVNLVQEPIDSVGFAQQIVTPIRMIAEEKGVHLVVDTTKIERRTIMMDRMNTQKIFLNILSNAIKFTPSGGEVSLIAESLPEPAETFNVQIIIRDTGIGISPDFLPKIYEPFSQESQVSSNGQTGTGLGLSIVRQLVDLMHGHIEIQSIRDKGTEVTVELQFDYAVSPAAVTSPGDGDTGMLGELQDKKILLCEDNELNTEIAKNLLEYQNMRVVCMPNGKAGVEAFKQSTVHEFDAVLMDLRMPVMDGYEAVRCIRALHREDAKTVPIIAMTADAYEEDVQKCIRCGMDGHVAKPVDPAKLFDVLIRLIRRAK